MTYRVLWFLEISTIVALFLVLSVPIQDYAMKEYKEYSRHPSPETFKAFQDKKGEEPWVRRRIAIPIAALALGLAIPIFRIRRRRTLQ
jgi:hypothetical protein